MKPSEEIVAWARDYSKQLKNDMEFMPYATSTNKGIWQANSPKAFTEIIARATAALEFLHRYAGRDSQWMLQATTVYASRSGNKSTETAARAIGDMLSEWASQVESGVIEIHGELVSEVRQVATDDLMSQVRLLLEDKNVNPAAPIVLAGAALEIALRGAVEEKQLTITDKPSIATLGLALRNAEVLTTQDMKDITQMGGLRNSAAHGQFDELSRERAGLMEQMVNLFLAKLTATLDGPSS